MTVTSTTSVTNATSSTSSTSSSSSSTQTLGYDQFLTLLVTEMKYQDPTKPMDPTETVSQLASFSSVEQAVKTNTTLTSILNSNLLTQASSFIGKTVSSSDGSTSGVVASVSTSSSGVTATLTDGKTISLGSGVTVSE
ncbi:flagellar basal body rod modification protein [Methylosinus sp. R-45379]|uniref:flagellar hook assembly protein FlgD n=1 Tax=Methylosinus sp. R-45379 TaxID=980563 RepID=UPI0007C8AE29|nr:flagellar hook assembly protein FlgD [Methylosinus sp. R-45379]OAI29602.1 flagellar basal body rod modification protein [Methylosinus sp. R-45379]